MVDVEKAHMPRGTYYLRRSYRDGAVILWYAAAAVREGEPECLGYSSWHSSAASVGARIAEDLREVDCQRCLRGWRKHIIDETERLWEKLRNAQVTEIKVTLSALVGVEELSADEGEAFYGRVFGGLAPGPMGANWRKKPLFELAGRRVKTRYGIANGVVEMPGGTELVIVAKYDGLNVRSDFCGQCGHSYGFNRCSPGGFEMVYSGMTRGPGQFEVVRGSEGEERILTAATYRKTPGRDLVGRWVVDDGSGRSGLASGARYEITRKYGGLEVTRESCGGCGARRREKVKLPIEGLRIID